jgi:hypothetical protein
LVLAIPTTLFALVLFLHFWKGVPYGELTRDPNAIAALPFYNGLLSQAGIFLWAAAATICFFCAAAISGHSEHRELMRFLIGWGVLTLLLGVDDAFQIHERVLPEFGIPQEVMGVVYIGLTVLGILKFRGLIRQTPYALLAAALGFFAISQAFDAFWTWEPYPLLYEDGAKLMGIVFWLAYFFEVGRYTLVRVR